MDKMTERESIKFAIENAGRVWKTRESQTRERLAEALGSLLGMVERGDLRIKEGGSETVKALRDAEFVRPWNRVNTLVNKKSCRVLDTKNGIPIFPAEDFSYMSVKEFVTKGEKSGFPTVSVGGIDFKFGIRDFGGSNPLLGATFRHGKNYIKYISMPMDKTLSMAYVFEEFSKE